MRLYYMVVGSGSPHKREDMEMVSVESADGGGGDWSEWRIYEPASTKDCPQLLDLERGRGSPR